MKSDFPVINPPTLRPCPFCGGKAYLIGLFISTIDNDEINVYEVGCEKCDFSRQEDWYYDELVEWWNNRAYKP